MTVDTSRKHTATGDTAHDASGQISRNGEHATPSLARVGLFWANAEKSATDPFRSSGANVAAAGLVEALGRFADIAAFDVFTPMTGADAARLRLERVARLADGLEDKRIYVFPESSIGHRFQACRYDIVHDARGIDLTRGSYLRSRFSSHLFPVTCSQMGISYEWLFQGAFVRQLTAQVYPCDAIVCSTQASRRAMKNRLGDLADRYSRAWDRTPPPLPRLELIPWGVDANRFAGREREQARQDLELPIHRPVVLCIGRVRIEDKMDWTPLLLAFQQVRRKTKMAPLLVLAGATFSEYADRLVAQAAELGFREDVRTFFSCPPACLTLLYAACDIFVSPTDSVSESFGLTIVEAMASGRPVVASDWDGYRELITHGETGFRVRTCWADCLGELDRLAPALQWDQQHLHVGQSVCVDVKQMADYLVELLENRELREQMGERGRERVQALYDWPVVVKQWERLWCELCAISGSLTRRAGDLFDYMQPQYFQHFSHYASHLVDDSTSVRLTERGLELLAGRTSLFLHPWSQGFLDARYVHAALSALKPTRWIGVPLQIGDLVTILRRKHGLGRDLALMHLMWAAKYDLIAFGGAAAPAGAGSN